MPVILHQPKRPKKLK
ncbi:AgrD family cyclic lactone autoinducer peptide [Agathobacter rectalis]|uniref:Cyclic lactone autoinducer peptide n=1 Tax=Agathobacter rectalis TaxID=39491 RepID=A0A396F9U9_9FIRM|nr:cyclic lactone autoinducer peptide [Agathobacter rectalis]